VGAIRTAVAADADGAVAATVAATATVIATTARAALQRLMTERYTRHRQAR
jgi:hypothetical protein